MKRCIAKLRGSDMGVLGVIASTCLPSDCECSQAVRDSSPEFARESA